MNENKEKYEKLLTEIEKMEVDEQNLEQRKNSKSAMLLSFIDTNLNQLKKDYKSNKVSPDFTPKSSITNQTQSEKRRKSIKPDTAKEETAMPKTKEEEERIKMEEKKMAEQEKEREEMKSPFKLTKDEIN